MAERIQSDVTKMHRRAKEGQESIIDVLSNIESYARHDADPYCSPDDKFSDKTTFRIHCPSHHATHESTQLLCCTRFSHLASYSRTHQLSRYLPAYPACFDAQYGGMLASAVMGDTTESMPNNDIGIDPPSVRSNAHVVTI